MAPNIHPLTINKMYFNKRRFATLVDAVNTYLNTKEATHEQVMLYDDIGRDLENIIEKLKRMPHYTL